MRPKRDVSVTLAIAPTSRGFGYVVFEDESVPLDWGVKGARENKSRHCLMKARELMRRVQPSALVLEDTHQADSQRAKRIKLLIDRIGGLAKQKGIAVIECPRRTMLEFFGTARNKDDIAETIVKLLPEFDPKLPPRRRMWESEHYNMAIFEAAALALTYFGRERDRHGLRTGEW
jgi:hypothetical protein